MKRTVETVKLTVIRGRIGSMSTRNANLSPFKPGNRTLVAKTCAGCGHLLSNTWYRRFKPTSTSAGGYLKKCERCRRVGEAPQAPRSNWRPGDKYWMQRETQDRASNNRKPWMERDMEVLSNPDLTTYEKSLALKRTYEATRQAVKKHGFTSKIGLGDPTRDGWAIDNPSAVMQEAA